LLKLPQSFEIQLLQVADAIQKIPNGSWQIMKAFQKLLKGSFCPENAIPKTPRGIRQTEKTIRVKLSVPFHLMKDVPFFRLPNSGDRLEVFHDQYPTLL
jgi:hypothetical protein